MAESIKVNIDVFREKTAEEFTKALADPAGKLETGSACAVAAALSAALLERVAAIVAAERPEDQRAAYILKNAGILRGYMVHLIDEDVKSRGPLHKAELDGKKQEIEAARQPAVAICAEIANMMCQCLEFMDELKELCPKSALHYLGESANFAMSAVKGARLYIVDMADKSTDETYRFVIRRENEITLEKYSQVAQRVLDRAEEAI